MSKHQDFRDFVLNHEFDQFAKIEDGRAAFHLWQDEYEALQSAMATNAGGLSTIAQSKLEQMDATVHGVLVKNEAGAWAAVSDAGRVMWLDGFEGRADETRAPVMPSEHGKNRYGLDMAYFRELFNRELNRPLVDFRPDELARVLARAARTADAAVLQEPEFQAARAQSGQGAEAEGFDFDGWYDKHQNLFRDGAGKADLRAAYKQGYRDSRPQPAQQGSTHAPTDDRVQRAMQMPLKELATKFIEATDRASRNMDALKSAQQGNVPEAKIIIDRVVEELENGFVACERCGDQEDTATLDCMDDLKRLKAILSTPTTPQPEEGSGDE